MFIEFHKLVDAIVAWRDNHVSSCLNDLVSFYLSGCDSPFGKTGHGQLSATSPTAVVFLPVRRHLDKVSHRMLENEPLLFDQSSQPD